MKEWGDNIWKTSPNFNLLTYMMPSWFYFEPSQHSVFMSFKCPQESHDCDSQKYLEFFRKWNIISNIAYEKSLISIRVYLYINVCYIKRSDEGVLVTWNKIEMWNNNRSIDIVDNNEFVSSVNTVMKLFSTFINFLDVLYTKTFYTKTRKLQPWQYFLSLL